MPYTVPYTDSTNPAKPAITVADGALNTQTSLTFVGKNYAGYAPIFAGDLLHLLENFAAATAPNNPVQGQLWYDTASGNNILRVYDGAGTWNEAGSIKRAGKSTLSATGGVPDVTNASIGDLWVDTDNSQLYLFSGSSWLLVGPQFSAGAQTGPLVENIVDSANVSHSVISLYASSTDGSSYRVAIISKDSFTPKSTITGYGLISPGLNLSTALTSTSSLTSTNIWGNSQSSNALNVNGVLVDASNFLRGDLNAGQTTSNVPINIRSTGGLVLGGDLSFSIGQSNTGFVLKSSSNTNSIDFVVGGSTNAIHISPNGYVGVGPANTQPVSAFSVAGAITSGDAGVAGGLNINGLSGSTLTSIFKVDPTLGTTSSLATTITNSVTVNSLVIGSGATAGTVISPPPVVGGATGNYDIGSQTNPFRNIYAQSFVGSFNGNFTGSVTGSVSGTAASLKTPITVQVTGDVATPSGQGYVFTGQDPSGTASIPVAATTALIIGPTVNGVGTRTQATTTSPTDKFLAYQAANGGSLVSMDKTTYLKLDNALLHSGYGTPVGTIVAWGGSSSSLNGIPPGWLLCDGCEVNITDYPNLYKVIGNNFAPSGGLQGKNTFAVPDLRARFPLGRNSMNNLTEQTTFNQVLNSSGAKILTGGQNGAATNVISDSTAGTVGGYNGQQYATLTVANLPAHKHTLQSSTQNQYYAVSNVTSDGDSNTVAGYGVASVSGTAKGLKNSGNVDYTGTGTTTGSTGVNMMNPYLTVNYIIFAGSNL
jgi:microcystin-dependent protein